MLMTMVLKLIWINFFVEISKNKNCNMCKIFYNHLTHEYIYEKKEKRKIKFCLAYILFLLNP